MPNRYRRDEFAHWTCPPGVRFAQQFGLCYRVRSSADIDWVLQRNLHFLEDYLAIDPGSIDQQSAKVILDLVKEQPGLNLAELVPNSAALMRAAIAVMRRREALALEHDCARQCATQQSP
jgi:putative transposase